MSGGVFFAPPQRLNGALAAPEAEGESGEIPCHILEIAGVNGSAFLTKKLYYPVFSSFSL